MLFYPFTQIQLTSDITDVVYLNWMVPIQNVVHLLPTEIKLKTYEDNVLLTVLTYKHGNFRPSFFNRFKKIFASPVQSNWRVYIENTQDFGIQQPTVFFLKNCINEHTYALGSRIVSNVLQTHLPHSLKHVLGDKNIVTEMQSGCSNSPDLYTDVSVSDSWNVPGSFNAITSDRKKLIEVICNQDAAVSAQLESGVYAVGHIELKFQINDIKSLKILKFKSSWLKDIINGTECFAFLMPQVTFSTHNEKLRKIK